MSEIGWTEPPVVGGCRNPGCGHPHARHELGGGRCTAYHCRCRSWRGITEREYEEGKR